MKRTALSILLLLPAALVLRAQTVSLNNGTASMLITLNGGKISSMKLSSVDLNPIHQYGHFICFDRWGPSSEEDQALGIPQHGNASKVVWTTGEAVDIPGWNTLQMSCHLPVVGLELSREIYLGPHSPVFRVEEEILNPTDSTKVVNLVQHPTIGAPFLDESTIVDTHVDSGFSQSGTLPPVPGEAYNWPQAQLDGKDADLRYLSGDYSWWQEVLTFLTDGEETWSWVTAVNPSRGLLIGYLWPTEDYPWLNLWFNITNQAPFARGLEFGTSGLHQPWPGILAMDSIFKTPLYEEVGPGASIHKSYYTFMAEVPGDFPGVEKVSLTEDGIIIEGYGADPGWRIVLPLEGEDPNLGMEDKAGAGNLDIRVTPNPFRSETCLDFDSPGKSRVQLTLLEPGGRVVRSRTLDPQETVNSQLVLKGHDLEPGMYICRLTADDWQKEVKILRLH